MELVRVAPDSAWLDGRRPFVRLLAEAADALGGTLEMESAFGHVGRYRSREGQVRPIFGNALGLNAEAAAMLAADKDYTARLLIAEGLPAPPGMVLFSDGYRARMTLKNRAVAAGLPMADAALEFAERLGYPVIVKPNTGSEGRGVHRPRDARELKADVAALFVTDDRVRLEACVAGHDTRLTVLDGRVRLAYRRVPPVVVGDGVHSVAHLVGCALAAMAKDHRGPKLAAEDPRVARALAAQGVTRQSVPGRGVAVRLLDSANLSVGGKMVDLTGRLPPEVEALAVRAAAILGLRFAGVDILSPDLMVGVEAAQVLEVNAAPGLDFYASHGPGQWRRARALLCDILGTARSESVMRKA